MAEPSIDVWIVDGKGYVCTSEAARRLRADCRLIGSMIGDVQRKSSGDEGCLPLVLTPEEITLALKRGWITLKESGRPDSKGGPGSPAAQEPLLAPTAIEVASRVKPQNVQHWSFPVAFRERLRCAIFEDLHSKGFYLTDGVKFGGDWLAYPGDPLVYHAQFVVRVVAADEAMHPMFFISASREAHAARKHLLIAFGDPSEDQKALKVEYVTVAPYDGFGQSDRKKRKE